MRRLEQVAKDRNVAEHRDFRQRSRFTVVEQSREREALTITQLDARASTTCAKCRNHETFKPHTVCEVDRGDFRFELQPDVIFVDDGWFKVQTNAVFLKLNRYRAAAAAAALNDGNRKFATGEEAGNLAVHGDQVWFRESTQRAVGLHCANHLRRIAAHQKDVHGARESSLHETVAYFAQRTRTTTGDEAAITRSALVRERGAEVTQLVAADFRDADRELDLRCVFHGGSKHVHGLETGGLDHAVGLRRVCRVGHGAREHDGTIGLAQANVITREQRADL